MLRRTALAALITGSATLAWAIAGGSQVVRAASETPSASLTAVKRCVVAAIEHAEANVDSALRDAPFWVLIFNSPLNATSAAEREADAIRIIAAIAHPIEDRPELAGILGMRVEDVARKAAATLRMSSTELISVKP